MQHEQSRVSAPNDGPAPPSRPTARPAPPAPPAPGNESMPPAPTPSGPAKKSMIPAWKILTPLCVFLVIVVAVVLPWWEVRQVEMVSDDFFERLDTGQEVSHLLDGGQGCLATDTFAEVIGTSAAVDWESSNTERYPYSKSRLRSAGSRKVYLDRSWASEYLEGRNERRTNIAIVRGTLTEGTDELELGVLLINENLTDWKVCALLSDE